MSTKPTRSQGQALLERWANERGEHSHSRQQPAQNTHPRGNQEPHKDDLARSVERFEALLGR